MSSLVFAKLLVIFLIVAAGWVAARLRLLGGGDVARTLSNAAFHVFVPALLFRTTARIDFASLDARLLIAFFVPTLLLLGAVYAVERVRAARAAPKQAAVPTIRAITTVYGNGVQIGIPLAAALFGETGLALHLTVVSVHALILLTVLTALVEIDLARARRRADPGNARLLQLLATTVRATVVHPVVLPVLAGLAWNATGAALPAVADELLATLGQAVVPLCLVLIGVSLAQYGARGALRAAALLSLAKLVVQPLLVLGVARFGLGLGGVPLAIVVLMAALPVGSNALVFAQRYDTLQGEASTAIVLSTLGFVITAPLWLALLHALG
ncbi:MAG: AEC family transporter [Caldimonas sp.]